MFAGSTMIAPCCLHVGDRRLGERDRRRGCSRTAGCGRRRCARPSGRSASSDARVVGGVPWRRARPASPRSSGSRRSSRPAGPRRRPTVRAIGPAVSWLCAIGTMPLRLTQPERRLDADEAVVVRRRHDRAVGLGADRRRPRGSRRSRRRIPSSSRTGCDRARTDSSSGRRGRSSRSVECVERKFAHSLRFVLPRMTAPASRSRATTNASFGGLTPASASEPAVVIMRSAVAMLSLSRTGMPCSGPRTRPLLRSASRRSAIASASGLISMTLCSAGPGAIDRVDAGEVLLDQRARRLLPGLHPLLQVGDRRLFEVERARAAAARRRREPTGRADERAAATSTAGTRGHACADNTACRSPRSIVAHPGAEPRPGPDMTYVAARSLGQGGAPA